MQDRSKKLKWQFEKILEEPDIEKKIELLAHNLSNKSDLAEYAESLRKFPEFFNAVDLSYLQYDSIEEAYMQFEEKVTEIIKTSQTNSYDLVKANFELENLNIAINSILDGLGQGLLFFDSDGICSLVHSKACLVLLEANPSGKHIADVLKAAGNERQSVLDWIEVVFSDAVALSFDELKEKSQEKSR